MVNAIATSPKYQEFEAKHNRHLNMLAENVSLSLWSKMTLSSQNDLLNTLFVVPFRTGTCADKPLLSSTKWLTRLPSPMSSSSSTIAKNWCAASYWHSKTKSRRTESWPLKSWPKPLNALDSKMKLKYCCQLSLQGWISSPSLSLVSLRFDLILGGQKNRKIIGFQKVLTLCYRDIC